MNANVTVERDGAAEPQAVVLRLTPQEAETLQVAWLTAQTMLIGFMKHLRHEADDEAMRLVKNGLGVMLADPTTVNAVHALLKEVHRQMCHAEHGGDDGQEQNWRCN